MLTVGLALLAGALLGRHVSRRADCRTAPIHFRRWNPALTERTEDMGPKYIVVARHRDGSTTITEHRDESDARAAFDLVAVLPSVSDCFMAGVKREMRIQPEFRNG